MKFYIFWEGVKNKSNCNIIEDPTVTYHDTQFFKEVAQYLGKVLTKETVIFSVHKGVTHEIPSINMD